MSKIGILAVQGDFAEHCQAFRSLGVEPIEVRLPEHLEPVQGLVIPGGESTTIIKLMDLYGLTEAIKERARSGMSVWGTCAGMIVVSHRIMEDDLHSLDLIDLDVRRNAFGRQVDSFEADLAVPVLGQAPFHAVFIRAPAIERLGAGVELLTQLEDDTPVAACQGRVLVTAFHPELTGDTRFHGYFLKLAGIGQPVTGSDSSPEHSTSEL
ncbi:MAG: pyridoxal 5'-phosphate synthase glutaminase subunit PdxT [Chloroflexi bacterium]|nr:pyridoxal 5'-phosphate synthase glutaminase subunit PdxT [Chloroflexota bacterium]